jgi:hypothetical protein
MDDDYRSGVHWKDETELPDGWRATSRYSIARGEYSIVKVSVNGVRRYEAFRGHNPGRSMGVHFSTARQAKRYIDAIEQNKGATCPIPSP